ncbi:MFS transporter [Curtobacterium sp. ZW137]|uniref:MFS transporter n=1 Tax=Curtobacterium sp. ZW137 TaxID=2485104 RepID=UPI000F4C14D3|nr:MFS transporter [Curtobacterium sp. ZW137]ROP61189.1 SET family sugar efflux transporter-like MFS transporter [Curtobacterium sp. ZW137]
MEREPPPGRLLWPAAAWFWALQFAVLNPLLAVLLVTLAGATPTEVGWVLGCYNVGGFVASLVIPATADRTRDYLRPLLFCALAGAGFVAALALTTSLPVLVIALVVLGGPPGVGSTLLFAQLRHEGAPPARVIRTRAIVSFAWVVGPPLATLSTGLAGTPAALLLLAGISIVNVVTALLLLRRRGPVPEQDQAVRPSLLAQLRGWSRWSVVSAFTLLQATNIATVTVATLFVARDLGAPIVWAGIVLGAAALVEIPALLVMGRLHERVPARTLLAVGCACGAVYYGLATLVHEPWQLLALQPLNAWFFASVAGVGLTVFQDVFPSPGLASGLFTNTRRVGAVLAGLLIAGLGGFPDPYRAVYAAAAGVVLVVLVVATAVASRSRPVLDAR